MRRPANERANPFVERWVKAAYGQHRPGKASRLGPKSPTCAANGTGSRQQTDPRFGILGG